MQEGTCRRLSKLQEATKTYTMRYQADADADANDHNDTLGMSQLSPEISRRRSRNLWRLRNGNSHLYSLRQTASPRDLRNRPESRFRPLGGIDAVQTAKRPASCRQHSDRFSIQAKGEVARRVIRETTHPVVNLQKVQVDVIFPDLSARLQALLGF